MLVCLGHRALKETQDSVDHKVQMEILGTLARRDHPALRVTLELTDRQVPRGHRARLAARVRLGPLGMLGRWVIRVQMVHRVPRVPRDRLGHQDWAELPE